VFAILWSLRKKGLAAGTIAWLYLILTGLMRFIVEFWRINPALGFGFSEAQWISLLLITLGVVLLVMRPIKSNTQVPATSTASRQVSKK
jgi:phosphatidylglycerol---prolipoprotein diacylglyceryl transferase